MTDTASTPKNYIRICHFRFFLYVPENPDRIRFSLNAMGYHPDFSGKSATLDTRFSNSHIIC